MSQSIIEFLNLKEEEVEQLQLKSSNGNLIVSLALKTKVHVCSNCGSNTSKTVSYYLRSINHGIFNDRKCIVHYNQRRLKCPVCSTTFNEYCSLVSKHQKKSLASHLSIMEYAKDPHLTFKRIGDLLHLSDTAVANHFYRTVPIFKPVFPKVLCIDEVYLGRNSTKKYVAHLLDFIADRTVDVIYGRTKDSLHSYCQKIPREQRNNVEFICSDMYEGYRAFQQTYFPKAKLCVDSFHVIKLILSMYDSFLKTIMKQFVPGSLEYYLLKKKRFILKTNSSKIDWFKSEFNYKLQYHIHPEGLKQLLFNIHPLIREIYDLKEAYISFNRITDSSLIPDKFNLLIHQFISHPYKDVKRVGRTLLKWQAEIINSFTWVCGKRISNGPIESRNNIIKLLIRNAAGYRNFDRLRSRIIYCINSTKKGR